MGTVFNALGILTASSFPCAPGLTVTIRARISHKVAIAVTGWAGPLDHEKALLAAHFTMAAAGLHSVGLVPLAAPLPSQGSHSTEVGTRMLACYRQSFLKGDFQIEAQIRARLCGAAALAAAHIAERSSKYPKKTFVKSALAAAATTILEGGVPKRS